MFIDLDVCRDCKSLAVAFTAIAYGVSLERRATESSNYYICDTMPRRIRLRGGLLNLVYVARRGLEQDTSTDTR
jgi:hypothetical protein